jgi:hypothetical protein
LRRIPTAIACALILWAGFGCEANALNPGQVLDRNRIIGQPGPSPASFAPSTGGQVPGSPAVGDSCHSDDPGRICLGLRYVAYRDSTGEPVVSPEAALKNIGVINSVWGQCRIAFQIDQYRAIKPADYKLRYQTANYSELEDIRNAFADDGEMLIVTTGTWDRKGSLGTTGANAWTAMPGGAPYGAILERPVGTFSNIIAHELGHYLNLNHLSDVNDIMNPIIYSTSTKLSAEQCNTARSAAAFFWAKMYR